MKNPKIISSDMLKWIALVTMIIDHIGVLISFTCPKVPKSAVILLRIIGRISFPIYCFLLIEGYKHTKSRIKYLQRLLLFALVSLVPYSLFAHLKAPQLSKTTSIEYDYWYLLAAIICLFAYWYFVSNKKLDRFMLVLVPCLFCPGITLVVEGYVILDSNKLNIFYTLAIGLVLVLIIDKIIYQKLAWYELIILAICLASIIFAYFENIDYSNYYAGIIIILGLYLTKNSKLASSISIFLWSVLFYGLMLRSPYYMLICLIPAVLVLLYNGKRKNRANLLKWAFYFAYPVHLVLLAIIAAF